MTLAAQDAPFRVVQRRLAEILPEAATTSGDATLETYGFQRDERPRLDPAELVEGKRLTAHDVGGTPSARVAAFLDGTQTSRVAQYIGAFPIVHGTVAAVVRQRSERRMSTWRLPRLRRRVYAPMSLLAPRVRAALSESGYDVCDTTSNRELESIHPFAVQEAALQAVQRDRSALERELAEEWCAHGDGELWLDGGISESATVARCETVIGVVKSHQQLYVHGDDLGVVMALRRGQRSSVTRVAPRGRTPVLSWYLRLRDTAARDPMFGLVRVEIADSSAGLKQIGSRADEVSRWVLAEALPLAIPDGRWDRMVYGVRDCEEFLRAIQ